MNYSGPFGLSNLESDMKRKAEKYELNATNDKLNRIENKVVSLESTVLEIADLRWKCEELQRMINELYGWRDEERFKSTAALALLEKGGEL